MKVYYTKCLIEGHACLVAFDYGSDNNVVSQRLVEKLQFPTTFHPNQAWIKFSTGQHVKEVWCDIAPVDLDRLLLGWACLDFKTLNLDEHSLYLRHDGHKMKLKIMTPRQDSKNQHRLKEKINCRRKGKWTKRNGSREKYDVKFICQCFFSIVCDFISQEQKDNHVNETHQLPCLKRKLFHSVLLCIWSADE